jgi:hypothetical protein
MIGGAACAWRVSHERCHVPEFRARAAEAVEPGEKWSYARFLNMFDFYFAWKK